MGVKIINVEMESMIHDGVEVQIWKHDGVEVYTAGKMVTYKVDSGVTYQEKVKKGHSCLSPTTFTPSKSGWSFVGWREDSTASGSVLSSKVMERSPITLYAVFRQTITLSYNGNGATSGSTASQTGTRYYNNGNVNNPSFTLRSNGFGRTYYNFQKWALNSAGGTQYSAGASITLSGNATMYAVWKQVVIPLFPNGGYSFQLAAQATWIRTLNVSASSIICTASEANYSLASILCTSPINLSDFSKLSVTFTLDKVLNGNTSYGYVSVGFSSSLKSSHSGSGNYYPDYAHTDKISTTGTRTVTLDLSNLSGLRYFEFYCGACNITITNITIT